MDDTYAMETFDDITHTLPETDLKDDKVLEFPGFDEEESIGESVGEFEMGNIRRRLGALRSRETREKKKVISKI